ncbi:MAG: hypothetical protein JWO62_3351 [Acidimicrobiaceae bacterium]|nr:hypothetical protein [Acidimicrobiaceae bacterium]
MSTDLSTYVAQRRALLAEATPRPWTAPTYETEEDDVWTIALCGPFEHHVIHEVDPFTPDGVTHEEYDRECEGCPSCGVDEAGTSPDARAIVALVNDADRALDVIGEVGEMFANYQQVAMHRERRVVTASYKADTCEWCGQPWPCSTARIRAALDRLVREET